MEKIISIKNIYNIKDHYEHYDGFEVKTSKNTYLFLIENGQGCSEMWGYFSANDDLEYFIGSNLKEVNLVGKALNIKKLKDIDSWMTESDCMFINFETTKGILQLAVYNAHNGYYSHNVKILINNTDMFSSDLAL